MANTHTVKDRLDEALAKSLILFFEADLVAAWGSDIEVVLGDPDFDYESRDLADGSTEPRDLAAKPLLVLVPMGGSSGPFCLGSRDDLVFRSTRWRVNLVAGSPFDILSLKGTTEAVMDGADSSHGDIEVVDPDPPHTGLGVFVYFDDQLQLSNVFSGPGENAQESVSLPEGKGQFGTLKHRASILFGIDIRKPRGSAVL